MKVMDRDRTVFYDSVSVQHNTSKGIAVVTTESRLTDLADIRRFLLAGNATFTLVSEKTGTHFTYRASRPNARDPERPVFFGVLTGPDNTSDYAFIGTVFPRDERPWEVRRSPKSKVATDAPSARALDYFIQKLNCGAIGAQLSFWHEGKCGRCGRKLTNPDSIASGLGPECAGKA